jgi:hypothetical protein
MVEICLKSADCIVAFILSSYITHGNDFSEGRMLGKQI